MNADMHADRLDDDGCNICGRPDPLLRLRRPLAMAEMSVALQTPRHRYYPDKHYNEHNFDRAITTIRRNAKPSFDKFHDGDLPIPCPIPIR